MTPQLRFPEFRDEWQVKRLGDVADIFDGTHQTPTYVKDGVPFYSVEQVTSDDFGNTKFIAEDVFESEKIKPEKGDILMTRIGDIGSAKLINWDVRASFYVSLALIKQSQKYTSSFLEKYIATDHFQNELWQRTIHVAFPKKINLGEISNCTIKLPQKPEQEKIADFLTAVDERIAVQDKKVEQLQNYKKAVMQQIFSQKIRFKNSSGQNYPDWQEKKLGNFLLERKQFAPKDGSYEHISLTTDGVVPKSERYERDFLVGSDDKRYRITKLNDICYNPANLKFGVIARNKYKDGIFSPIYVTYEVRDADVVFVEYMVTRRDFIQKARRFEEGTVYERMAVSPKDLASLTVFMPSIEEQQKIADFLTAIDAKITTEKSRLTAAREWKKGLLQRMFV